MMNTSFVSSRARPNGLLRVVAISVVLIGLVAVPALAGPGERRAELGFDLGRTSFDSEVSDKSGGAFGLRGGYHFTKLFQLEGQLSASAADERGFETTLSTFFVNGLLNFHPRRNIEPYLLVGVGQANLDFDLGPISVDDNGNAYQVAAGSRFFFGRNGRVAARVEASRMRENTFGENSDHTSVVTGVAWRLGRRS